MTPSAIGEMVLVNIEEELTIPDEESQDDPLAFTDPLRCTGLQLPSIRRATNEKDGFRYTTTFKYPKKIEVYPCSFCDFRTGKIKALLNHRKTQHGEKPYSCDTCSFKADFPSALKVHMRSHTGDDPYSCHFCDYRAGKISNLKRHLRTHTGEKPFLCDLCDYKASQRFNLKKHRKIHFR